MVADLLPYCRSLAQSPRRADRLLWLRIATDVLARADSADESLGLDWESHFAANLDLIDENARLDIAKRLANPGRVLTRLAHAFLRRSDPAALWTLEHASGLSDYALRRVLPSTVFSAAIARRADLSGPLIGEILDAADLPSLIELAGNRRVPLSKLQLATLISRAACATRVDGDARLARALLSRATPGVEYAPLFLEASSSQRAHILFAAQRADLGAHPNSSFARIDYPRIALLERHALERQSEMFTGELAEALDCEPALAARIIRDPFGEPLAVTLAALNAPNDASVRILTACDMAEGSDYPRISALARLQGALSPAAAGTVVAAFLGEAPRMAGEPSTARRIVAPLFRRADLARSTPEQQIDREAQARISR
jgi:hypothetical protein